VFDGLDDIDWQSMDHAYGPAGDMPYWVRGLVDPDPATREQALDAMYGAVHHQGDVYDCTLAVMPYLIEALTTPGLPGRDGIAELLAGIAGYTGRPADTDPDRFPMRRELIRANEVAVAAAPALVRLLDDPDPAVRAAAPPLLVTVAAAVPDLPAVLVGLLGTEGDPAAAMALLRALGSLTLDTGTVDHLLGLARTARASTALAALIAVARNDGDRVPFDDVPDIVERAYAEDTAADPAGFRTETLIGELRIRREAEGRRAPHCDRIIEELTEPLGHRVAGRITILTPLLASSDDHVAGDAMYAANKLIHRRRGDYREVAARVGALLDRSGPPAGIAGRLLGGWGTIAAPAADAVARHLADLDSRPWRDGRPQWNAGFFGMHPLIDVLTALGDERALPLLLTALRLRDRPSGLGNRLARYPGHGAAITAEIVAHFPASRGDDRPPNDWFNLQAALQAFGAAAAPAVPLLLASPLQAASATTLGRIGPAAADGLTALRAATTSDDPDLVVAAAGALWRIERSPATLPLLTTHLDGPAAAQAFSLLAAMGPAAAAAAPLVAAHLDAPPARWWTSTHAALALWRLTGDTDRVAPILTRIWHDNPRIRPTIAEAAAGTLAAALEPVWQAELAAPLRFTDSDSPLPAGAADDEELLASCRARMLRQNGRATLLPAAPAPENRLPPATVDDQVGR
jgi:hypothetical protein